MALKGQITSGLKWSAFSKGASQIVSWVVTIYVIRLLAPSDYGLMAMASVVIAFLSTFNEFGLGSALVQSKKLDDENIGAVYGAMLLLGALLTALLALSSPWIADFFNESRLQALIAVAGLQFLLSACTIVPESMMRRNMAFKPLSLADLYGAVCGSLSTLFLALSGYGVWSLVVGNLTGAFIRSGMLIALNPRRVSPNFRLSGAITFLSFGGYMTAARFVAYFASQADILIGAKLLGKDALGIYTVSVQLASLPVDKVMSTINQIVFSAVSKMQEQRQELLLGLEKAIRLLAYLAFPAVFGMSSVATEFIPLLLGVNWIEAVLPLQLVSIVIPLRMVTAVLGTALYGLGRADVGFKNTLTSALILPVCFFTGVQWGVVGLASGWVIGSILVFFVNFKRTNDVIGFGWKQLSAAVSRPLLVALLMVLFLMVLRELFGTIQTNWGSLIFLVFSGAFFYATTAVVVDRELKRSVFSKLNELKVLMLLKIRKQRRAD